MPTIKLTTEQNERLQNADDVTDEFFDALYEAFLPEMPYGTAKARDGDPYNWIADHMNEVTVELTDQVTYAHQADPKGVRFQQYTDDPLPGWAVDVQPVMVECAA